jgi:hypothetical protein
MSGVTEVIHKQIVEALANATHGSAKSLEQTLSKLPELLEANAKLITQQYAVIADNSQKLAQKNNALKAQVTNATNDLTKLKAETENVHINAKSISPDQARSLLESTPKPGSRH